MPSTSATNPQASTTVADLVTAIVGADGLVVTGGWGMEDAGCDSCEGSVAMASSGCDCAASRAALLSSLIPHPASRCSSAKVPAGRTSSHNCALAVTIAPTIADFQRSSEAPGDQRRVRARSQASERRMLL